MKSVSMVAIEREQFGDYEKIIRPKLRTQQFTWHKTESKHYTVDFMCMLHLLYFSPHVLIMKSEYLATLPKQFQCTFMTQRRVINYKVLFFSFPSFAIEELEQGHL